MGDAGTNQRMDHRARKVTLLSLERILFTYRFSTNYALISQTDQNHYVRLDFGPSKDVKVIQSMINENAQCTQFVVPPHPFSVRLIHCLAEKIIVVNAGFVPRSLSFLDYLFQNATRRPSCAAHTASTCLASRRSRWPAVCGSWRPSTRSGSYCSTGGAGTR